MPWHHTLLVLVQLTIILCILPRRSVPSALNPSLVAFVNKETCFLKSSGLLKTTVCSRSARMIRHQSYTGKLINVSGRTNNSELFMNVQQYQRNLLPSVTIKLEFPLISWSSDISNSSNISHPCARSFCLAVLAKLAFNTVGVLGVPISLRDLRMVDLGVSAIMSANSLLFVGVGGHLRSLSPSLVFSKLTWSMAAPNINWSSGVQTWNLQMERHEIVRIHQYHCKMKSVPFPPRLISYMQFKLMIMVMMTVKNY